jgi:hypothetical protein
MKHLEKLWKIIDGNKTIICTFVLFVLQLPSVKEFIPTDLMTVLNYIFGAGAAGSAIHHVSKGKLKQTEK